MINEAEGYRNEQVALARATRKASLFAHAEGYSLGKKNRASKATPAASHSTKSAFRAASRADRNAAVSGNHGSRCLPGRKKMIVDSSKGRRHLLLLDDGIEFAAGGCGHVDAAESGAARSIVEQS